MTTDLTGKYGPWGVVAGGSDGVGAAFAQVMAQSGMNVVLVARRESVLDQVASDIRASHGVEVRTIILDLSDPGAIAELEGATSDLEVGLFVFNAGGGNHSIPFLEQDLDHHLGQVQRNCASVLEAAHRFGAPMVARGRGALVLLSSTSAWVGGLTYASYSATKSFDLILAEGLWAEWRDCGVDVLAPVLGLTDTPSMRRVVDAAVLEQVQAADPYDVAVEVLDHLGDGPTWLLGSDDPEGGSPFGAMSRRDAVLTMAGMVTGSSDEE
ncbi:MAG: short-chain dehydrogenase [Gordonia sp.]|nr:short-chain dehydrogenase [Gordonia sp. (in: high G+C Gram-positive bacteria)]